VELAGETNATLFLGAVSNASAGIYTLEVSGACGRATNHTAVAPRTNVVVAALTNQTVCAGGAAAFTANVTGTGPFTFVWKKNGAVFSNVTSGLLVLTNLFPSDGALYTVEVTTFCNTATASALLTVESSLTATPLTNLTACVGQNVTFTTTAAGGPPFTYLWRRDGSALTNQTNATLVLTNVQLTNAGIYSVEVTGCGRATNSAQLAVTPPVAAAMPAVTNVCACDDFTLAPVLLTPGSFTYAWRKNGALLPGETNLGLHLPMLNMHSPGRYSVEITGPCNSLALTTLVEVVNVNSGTWTNNDGAITIRDFTFAAPYPSTNLVRCAPKTISQLRVTLFGLSHGFPDDIDLALVAPNGQGIKLMSDTGGSGGNALNNITLVFDDAAPGLLPNAGFINPGTYRPTDVNEGVALPDNFPSPGPAAGFAYATNFAQFLGSNPNGTWKLFVVDDHGGQQGVLTRWMLDFGRAEFVFPNVRLTSPVTLTNGALQMELRGEPGKTYFLEASTNLVNWTIIQTNQLLTPTMPLTDETASQFGYRFYRASGCRE
jgi:Immunoglobulin I-set domain/Proprotein convertase P-domain